MDDLKNLTAEKVIPVTPEKQEEMSWEATTEPPVTPEKQEEEVLRYALNASITLPTRARARGGALTNCRPKWLIFL